MRFLPGQLQSIVYVYNQHAEREDVHPIIVAKYLKRVVAILHLHDTPKVCASDRIRPSYRLVTSVAPVRPGQMNKRCLQLGR